MLKVGSLFSGIGGFDLGLERAGFEIKWQVEINDFCQKILTKHWPKVPKFRDIRDCGKGNLEAVDLICGGFPCQPFSVAGKRKGKEDDRYLWPEMLRIISELQPAWVVGENVAGLVSLGLDDCLSDLENQGYETQTFIIPACAVNAPHRRDRVWVIAQNAKHNGRYIGRHGKQGNIGGKRNIGARNEVGIYTEEITSHSTSARLEGTFVQSKQRNSRRFTAQDRGQSQVGNKDWLKIATELCRVDDGVSAELHIIGGIENGELEGIKTKPEVNAVIRKILRYMWEQRKTSKASQNLYKRGFYNLMPNLSYKNTYQKWNLGRWCEETAELHDLWKRFYSEGFTSTSNLQCKVLECIRKIERTKKVGTAKDRKDRLEALGNAVVPQIPEIIGQMIRTLYA